MLKKNLNLLFLILFAAGSLMSFSQTKAVKKQSRKILKEAQFYFDGEDYVQAWKMYKEVILINPKNERAGVNAAICLFKLNYPVDSAFLLGTNLSTSSLIDAKYYLAKIKHQQHLFDEAIVLLQAYLKTDEKKRLNSNAETNYLIDVCTNGKAFYLRPHRSVIRNMGPEINSSYPDYVPVIVPDESAMFFTSKRNTSTGGKRNGDGSYYEDVYVSHKQDGKWLPAQNVGAPINSETNDACVAISPDGQRMIVYRTSRDQISGDLYITKIGIDNKWEPLQMMIKDINSSYVETSACFSNDTSEIYFSSDRPGGYGGKDIYRIKKFPNGHWAAPYNLGPTINTMYDDDAPFLHPDGVTLYFSSKGHNTMGEYDVFRSILNTESNQFSEAENLGYPINDVSNDIFFVLSVDGQRGYYSSIKQQTFGGVDIYQIDTRFGDNDLKVKHGNATIDGAPAKVKITLLDNETNQVNGNYYSNPHTGRFIVVVNPLKSYKAVVEAEGCNTIVLNLEPVALEKTDVDLDFKLKKTNAQ